MRYELVEPMPNTKEYAQRLRDLADALDAFCSRLENIPKEISEKNES